MKNPPFAVSCRSRQDFGYECEHGRCAHERRKEQRPWVAIDRRGRVLGDHGRDEVAEEVGTTETVPHGER